MSGWGMGQARSWNPLDREENCGERFNPSPGFLIRLLVLCLCWFPSRPSNLHFHFPFKKRNLPQSQLCQFLLCSGWHGRNT